MSQYPLVYMLHTAMEADGNHSSFVANIKAGYPTFYVRVDEGKVSWRGMATRKLEKLMTEVPIDKVPTIMGSDWLFEGSENTQFFLNLRMRYGI